ncbi:MAG TPA: HAD-IIA family hydrolase [Chromatiaceae bacterium]|nr:HAD-IIA family hydrolase [Chromatiaceae bacterium]
MPLPPRPRGFIFDLDGTLYRGERAIPGAAEFLVELEKRALPYVFATNRANRTPEEVAAQLRSMGIACRSEQILTSAQATAEALQPGRACIIGQPALIDALARNGIEATPGKPDYVIVGFDETLTYRKLATACRWLLSGARYIATNPDNTFNTADGVAPENGAVIAAIHAATGRMPEVIGKPEAPLFRSARRLLNRLHPGLNADFDALCMVGDNLDTDILGAKRLGICTILMMTGIARGPDAAADRRADIVAEDYAGLTQRLFSC